MRLTERGTWVLVIIPAMLLVIACGVIGQHLKAERLANESGTIPPLELER